MAKEEGVGGGGLASGTTHGTAEEGGPAGG
jgi:hypothetical protein